MPILGAWHFVFIVLFDIVTTWKVKISSPVLQMAEEVQEVKEPALGHKYTHGRHWI